MRNSTHKILCCLLVSLISTGCANRPSHLENVKTEKEVPTKPTEEVKNDLSQAVTPYDEDLLEGSYAKRPEVQGFINQMVQKHGFSSDALTQLFSDAKRLNTVIRLETGVDHTLGPPKPYQGSWSRYRAQFLSEDRILNGVEFWTQNAAAIEKASETYQVDPEYIVGIIGVETYFGRNIGKTCVFDALTTLAFDTHRRPKFFKDELEQFLLMTREEGYQPRRLVGSWAGAMGLGQFMPSSFRRLAVDFDDNGKRNLWQPVDAIGSVAHYFAKNGWRFHNPVAELTKSSQGSSVIDLSTYEGDEYWQTFPNFKVIKRYNNSKKYVMAVHQLAQAIKQRLPLSQSKPDVLNDKPSLN